MNAFTRFNKLTPLKKLLVCIACIIIILLLLAVFVNLTSIIVYWLDNIIITNELNSTWINFWGSLLSALISAALLYLTVKITIVNSKQEHNTNINELRNDRKLNVRPFITSCPIEESEILRSIVFRDFSVSRKFMVDNGYSEKLDTTESSKNALHIFFTYKNIGLGPAINIILSIKEVVRIDGIGSMSEVFSSNIDSLYHKCTCGYYKRQVNGNIVDEEWIIYPNFSLGLNEDKNFCFYFSKNLPEMYFIINLSYEDILGNKYIQNHFFAVNHNIFSIWTCPISYQEAV